MEDRFKFHFKIKTARRKDSKTKKEVVENEGTEKVSLIKVEL